MPPKKNVSILVADDSSSMRSALARFLRQAGFRVITANDGQDALDALLAKPYDMVVSDWDMPRLSGLELLKSVRSEQRLRRLPFLMTTVKQGRKDIEQAIKAGVSDYIVKPFSAKVLVEKVERLLQAAENADPGHS